MYLFRIETLRTVNGRLLCTGCLTTKMSEILPNSRRPTTVTIKNFDWSVAASTLHPTVLHFAPADVWTLWGGRGGGLVRRTVHHWLTRHFGTPCASGCRETATFARRQHTCKFENGRKLSTKAETIMKITTSPAMSYGRSVKISHVRLVISINP